MKLDLHISLSMLLLFGCTDASEFGGKAINLGGIKDEASDEEDENEPISEPSEVAGAFLYCAFWNDNREIKGKSAAAASLEKNSTRSVLNGPEIACGMYKANYPHDKVEDDDLIVEWSVMSNDQEHAAPTVKQEFDKKFHTIVKVPVDKTGGAIVGKYRSSTSHLPGYRLKDIASITESGAKDPDFEITKYLSQERRRTTQMLLNPPTEITAAGQEIGCDTKCATLIGFGLGIVAAVIQPAAAPEIQRNISNSSNSTSHDGNHRYKEIRKKTADGRLVNRGIRRSKPVYPVDRQGREYDKPRKTSKESETSDGAGNNTNQGTGGDSDAPVSDGSNGNAGDTNPLDDILNNNEGNNTNNSEKPNESKFPEPKQKENVVGESKLVEPIEHAKSSDSDAGQESSRAPQGNSSVDSGVSAGSSPTPQGSGSDSATE